MDLSETTAIHTNIYLAMEYVDESKRTFVGNIGLALILTIR